MMVFGFVFVALVLILSFEVSPFGYLPKAGKPSRKTVAAPRTVQYVDEAKTEQEQDAAAAAVEPVYKTDASVARTAASNLDGFFKVSEEVNGQEIGASEKANQIAERTRKNLYVPEIGRLLALDPAQRSQAQQIAGQALAQVMSGNVTAEKISDAYGEARRLATGMSSDPDVQRVAGEIAAAFIEPNTLIDQVATDQRREEARKSVKPVITTTLEGEVIISKGEIATPEQVELLKTLGFKRSAFSPLNILYIAIFILVLLGAVSMFLARFKRHVYDSPGLLILLGGLLVFYALISKILVVAAEGWSPAWGYMMPCAVVAIISAVLTDTDIAISAVVACGLITGIVTRGNFSLTAFAVLGGIFPALFVSRRSGRHALRGAGLYTALWLALVAFSTSALTVLRQGMLLNAGIGFLNGVLSSVLALGLLPFLETTFRVTTNTWLLELASPEQPLLKELSMKAPGTYSHSVMVANLAEAAAREVGIDPLMARVAAYYHDVGKARRPQFFVENQPQNANPHGNISPNLSSLIITSHVKDGVDMLEKNHMPPDLVDIVKQHHGTGVVRYFYEKALEGDEKAPVDETRFRYHFEKPRSKTAAILLLADSVEATARTLEKPSASSIEQMVDRIVNGKMHDGQLDESDLTFHDLNGIKTVFSKILISTYHPRIDYPVTQAGGKKKSAGKNNLRAAGAPASGGKASPGSATAAEEDGGQ